MYSEKEFTKDCPGYEFIPTILPPVKRIIAIGDIHGDLDLAIRSFKLANLIDDNLNWIADPPDTIVVQVGDQIDSCRPTIDIYDCQGVKYSDDKADDINILNFFNQMHLKASKTKGAVYSLLGNHELINSQGNFNYVSYENYHNFYYKDNNNHEYKNSVGRLNAFKPGGPVARMMACTRPSVLIIGSTMFVHGGILPVLATKLSHLDINNETKLKYLNAIVRKWLLNIISPEYRSDRKLFINDLNNSPFWTRIFGSIPPNTSLDSDDCDRYVKKSIEVYQIGQLVVGHTPQLFTNSSGINGTCYTKTGNKLYRIDGGFSKAFRVNGKNMVQILEILDDKTFNIITASINTTNNNIFKKNNFSPKIY